jgi:quercetin dioxygenase-like cupin family protein
MPIIKYQDIKLSEVKMNDAESVSKAVVIAAAEGWQGHALRVFKLGPGGFTPRHRHGWEHVNYIIAGRGRLMIENEVYDLKEKDFAFVPPEREHRFENTGDDDFEFICIVPDRGEH